jgi:hypothetical protein
LKIIVDYFAEMIIDPALGHQDCSSHLAARCNILRSMSTGRAAYFLDSLRSNQSFRDRDSIHRIAKGTHCIEVDYIVSTTILVLCLSLFSRILKTRVSWHAPQNAFVKSNTPRTPPH